MQTVVKHQCHSLGDKMNKLLEAKLYTVTDPYNTALTYHIYMNPSHVQLKALLHKTKAMRGISFGDSKTIALADGTKIDHISLGETLVDQLGFDSYDVDYGTDFFLLSEGNTQEFDSFNELFETINGIKIGIRNGDTSERLAAENTGFKRAIYGLRESEIQDMINLLIEDEIMEASLGRRLTAIATSIGLSLSTVLAPLASITRGENARSVVSNSERQSIVIDPETFERWMTEPSHDEVEYNSMIDQQKAEARAEESPYDINTMVQSEEFLLLSLTMWGEARSHGEEGMRAVGHVIMNRVAVNANMFGGDTVRGVVTKDRQFSCWNRNDPNYDRMLNIDDVVSASPDGQMWKLAQVIAVQILTGHSQDPTRGATMYHTNAISPVWADGDRNVEVARIANHIFYVDTRWT